MPVVKIDKISDKSSVVLWKVTEDLSELNNLGQKEGIVPPEQDIHNDVKKMEWIAGRLALKKLVQSEGLHYQGIVKDEYGKPHLQNLNGEISLTHSIPYFGAIFHLDTIVGIDLEQPKTKMVNIATKFLSDAEMKNAGNRTRTYLGREEKLPEKVGIKYPPKRKRA